MSGIALFLISRHNFLHFLTGLGIFGLLPISVVDSSFVPLPIPGVTDIMCVVFAAQHENVVLVVALASIGSLLGGYFSYQVGHAGGMTFLEHHVSPRVLKPIQRWMESHPILAVALPAILPPPAPLSPFVLAAGALNMSRKKFLTAFTISRFARHVFATWLGLHYGRHIIHLWNELSTKWAFTALTIFWVIILLGLAIAFWRLYKTSRSVGIKPRSLVGPRPRASA